MAGFLRFRRLWCRQGGVTTLRTATCGDPERAPHPVRNREADGSRHAALTRPDPIAEEPVRARPHHTLIRKVLITFMVLSLIGIAGIGGTVATEQSAGATTVARDGLTAKT